MRSAQTSLLGRNQVAEKNFFVNYWNNFRTVLCDTRCDVVVAGDAAVAAMASAAAERTRTVQILGEVESEDPNIIRLRNHA